MKLKKITFNVIYFQNFSALLSQIPIPNNALEKLSNQEDIADNWCPDVLATKSVLWSVGTLVILLCPRKKEYKKLEKKSQDHVTYRRAMPRSRANRVANKRYPYPLLCNNHQICRLLSNQWSQILFLWYGYFDHNVIFYYSLFVIIYVKLYSFSYIICLHFVNQMKKIYTSVIFVQIKNQHKNSEQSKFVRL